MIRFHTHGFGEFEVGQPFGPHTLGHFDLLSLYEGHVELRLNQRKTIELVEGQSILIYPHTRFSGQSITGTSRASVQHFELSDPPATSLSAPLKRLVGRSRGYKIFYQRMDRTLERDIRRAIQMAHGPATKITLSMRMGLLTLIIGQLLSAPSSMSHPVTTATIDLNPLIDWLDTRCDKPTSLDQMAQFVGVSASHFRLIFTQQIGQSPGRYLQQLRLGEARRLLRETRIPIKQISQSVGYETVAHFYRFFAGHEPLTPAGYRKRYRLKG